LGLPGSEAAAQGLAGLVGGDVAKVETRKFPDEETYVRVDGDVADGDCIVVAQMVRPDEQLMPLVFLADALRDLGAARVGLVLPYLPYMRQDTRFLPGEAITSRSFARLLSSSADWLVTVDPHLHRYASLDELYTLRSHVVSSSDAIAEWVQREVPAPLIIGPDAWQGGSRAHGEPCESAASAIDGSKSTPTRWTTPSAQGARLCCWTTSSPAGARCRWPSSAWPRWACLVRFASRCMPSRPKRRRACCWMPAPVR
jgi:hypothetical protein